MPGSPDADQLIDITGEPLEQGIRSLQAHQQYLAELGGDFSPRTMLEEATAAAAADSEDPQVQHALALKAHRMG